MKCLLDIWDPKQDRNYMPVTTKRLLHAKYNAHRYLFTDRVATELGLLLKEHPQTLINNIQFALPPYETTYLQFSLMAFLKGLGARTTAEVYGHGSEADGQIGYLIHKGQVSVLVFGVNERGTPHCSPLGISIDPDHTSWNGFTQVKGNGSASLAFALGSLMHHPKVELTEERASDIEQRVRIWLEHDPKFRTGSAAQAEYTRTLFEGAMGEPRNIWALLMWINQPRVYHDTHIPASRGWVGNRSVTYASHRVVDFSPRLGTTDVVRAFSYRSPHRRHEVEAFWRNYNKNPGCVHEFPILSDDRGRWTCSKCGQWRIRISEHMRGDASRGFVTKLYQTSE